MTAFPSSPVASRLELITDILWLSNKLGAKTKHKVMDFSTIRILKTLGFVKKKTLKFLCGRDNKIPDRSDLREEGFTLAHCSRGHRSVQQERHGRGNLGLCLLNLHGSRSKESSSKSWHRQNLHPISISNGPLPPVRCQLLKFLQPPQVEPWPRTTYSNAWNCREHFTLKSYHLSL